MFIQIAETGKPKWQAYTDETPISLADMRELLAPAFNHHLLFKQAVPQGLYLCLTPE
jgi:hypothetical protein